MVREVLLVNWLYHIFQCKLSLNTRNWLKHVTLFNVTCLRKISSKCSSQINFPNMWHWSMSHVWEIYMNFPNMWHWTMSHVWEVYLTATFWRDFSQTCFNSYLYTLLECKSNDFKNVTLKNPYLLTRVEKQSKTRPSASCWIVSTLVSRYGFFNVTFLKSLDYLNTTCLAKYKNCNFRFW